MKFIALIPYSGKITPAMRHFRHHQKLISVVFLLGFFLATLEIHADHEEDAAQQDEHCCVQCCPSQNLAPASEIVATLEQPLMLQSTIGADTSFVSKDIPQSIFRPPIPLS
jgi:hypothetical protein